MSKTRSSRNLFLESQYDSALLMEYFCFLRKKTPGYDTDQSAHQSQQPADSKRKRSNLPKFGRKKKKKTQQPKYGNTNRQRVALQHHSGRGMMRHCDNSRSNEPGD
uniref:Uncharacterized protein n=1 Tax=Entomoneis paludosa TaxID=265537 RepID=A0A7S2YNM4_9STRA